MLSILRMPTLTSPILTVSSKTAVEPLIQIDWPSITEVIKEQVSYLQSMEVKSF